MERVAIAGKVDLALRKKVDALCMSETLTISDVVERALIAFLDKPQVRALPPPQPRETVADDETKTEKTVRTTFQDGMIGCFARLAKETKK